MKDTQRYLWESLAENEDLVFFYATAPVSGVVGFGIVRTKFRQDSPLWPAERVRNEVIWPLRFEYDFVSCLPPSSWQRSKVGEELRPRARSGFQVLSADLANRFIKELPTSVSAGVLVSSAIGPRAPLFPASAPAIPERGSQHHRLKSLLVEIGSLQRFVADMEFPIESRRLDVVWRRVQRSVPSYVFEVQVGGNLTEAMGKLKQAYDHWNSNLFLVGAEQHRAGVSQLAGGAFREIQERVKFIEHQQVEDLYTRKRAFVDFETQLGILAP